MRAESWLRTMSVLVLVGVFAAGGLFGAAVMRWTAPTPPPPPRDPIEAIVRELALDPDQASALHSIAIAHGPDLQAIARATQPKIRAVLFAIEDELRPRLRPDQVEKLEAWRARRPTEPPP
jgi:hypothetical protein